MDVKSSVFTNQKGEHFEHPPAIVPLVTIDKEKDCYVFIGTAFYISNSGVLLTAKHNLFDNKKKLFENLFVVHFFKNESYIFRPIRTTTYSNEHDLAYLLPEGILDKEGNTVDSPSLILTDAIPEYDEQLGMYGYPNSRILRSDGSTNIYFNSEPFLGKCRDYFPNGFSILKNPCFQTSILIKGGASGGPVFDKNGNVFAVCSTGYEIDDGGENISFVTPVSPSFNLVLNDNAGNELPILELIERGIIAYSKVKVNNNTVPTSADMQGS